VKEAANELIDFVKEQEPEVQSIIKDLADIMFEDEKKKEKEP
jgi:hypothetical protein